MLFRSPGRLKLGSSSFSVDDLDAKAITTSMHAVGTELNLLGSMMPSSTDSIAIHSVNDLLGSRIGFENMLNGASSLL